MELITPNKQCHISLRAAPLPNKVTSLLENNSDLIKLIDKYWCYKNSNSTLSNPENNEQEFGKYQKKVKSSINEKMAKNF